MPNASGFFMPDRQRDQSRKGHSKTTNDQKFRNEKITIKR